MKAHEVTIRAGVTVGDYEVRGELGRGGTGIVYLVHDKTLDRLVAIKVLRAQFAHDPVWVERFRREAQAVAALNHPNIVTLYKVTQLLEQHAIVMEYFDGISLARLLQKSGPLDTQRALHVARLIASALKAAHSNGIVHRDIKPHNIMVNRAGNVKLMDFGIARLGVGSSSMSLTSSAMGTPHYMSPEQCQGGNVDARTDIYSLGVTLFEMLTGRVPFVGETPLAVMYQICSTPFPPLNTVAREAPKPVARMVSFMTAVSPSARYPSASAVLADITSYVRQGTTPFADSAGAGTGSVGATDRLQAPSLSGLESMEMPPIDFALDGLGAPAVPARALQPSSRFSDTIAVLRSSMWTYTVLAGAIIVLALCFWLFRSSSPESANQASNVEVSASQSRTIEFPPETVLGYVLVTDAREPSMQTAEMLGPARGQVLVPEGKLAILMVRRDLRDFSDLKRVDPNAIQGLDFDNALVRDEDLAIFANWHTLLALRLDSKDVTDAGVAHLVPLVTLQGLRVSGTQITDKGVAIIAQLPALWGLEIGRSTKITDDGFAIIARMPLLKELIIQGIQNISDSGLANLGNASNLTYLNINRDVGASSPFGDAGIRGLSSLNKLEVLYMRNTNATDECIPALAQMHALKSLHLGAKHKFSEAGIARLRSLLPECKVED